MKIRLLPTLAFLLLAASCSESGALPDSPENGTEEETVTPIRLRGSSLNVSTRSPYEGAISSANPLTAVVVASLTNGNYATQYTLGTMTFKSGNTVYDSGNGFTGQRSYPSNRAENVYLVGLYPYQAGGWGSYGTTAAFTFTGKEDVMSAPQVTTNLGEAHIGTFQELKFSHLLTKLEISVIAENTEAATAWGKIEEVTLTKNGTNTTFNNVATVTLSSGVAAFSGTTATTWPTYEVTNNGAAGTDFTNTAFSSKSVAIGTTATKVAYTMVVPVTATGNEDYTLKVVTKRVGATASYTTTDIPVSLKKADKTAFIGSTAGNSFQVTLTFKATDIAATASVTAWTNGGNSNSDID